MFFKGLIFSTLVFSQVTLGKLFVSPEDAIKLKYGKTVTFEKQNIALSHGELAQVRKLAKQPLSEKIFTFYKITVENKKFYAGIFSDLVRTKNQTLMAFIDSKGKSQGIEIIANYEPPEYLPPKKWLKQSQGKTLKDPLSGGKDIPLITGSTLTTDSTLRSLRLLLAVWQVKFAKPEH